MADSDKNILISPQRGSASVPSITFVGQGNDPITLKVLDGTPGALSFEGSTGELLRLTNSPSVGTPLSYSLGETYIIWNDDPEVAILDAPSAWRSMKTFVASRAGNLKLKFSGYIEPGSYYWAWRIVNQHASVVASGHYNSGLDTGETSATHAYRRFVANITIVQPGDILTLQMVSADGSGNALLGVTAGSPPGGQRLFAKEFRAYNYEPFLDHGGSSNVWGSNIGIGTTSPLQTLDVRGNFLLAADSTTSTHITQKPYTTNNGTLSWEGTAGQLFSITNNLTSGSIFSVNDVSGIPSIDVDANGTISIAAYAGSVGIGTTSPSSLYKLDVLGDVRVDGNLTITQTTTISGLNADQLDGLDSIQFLRSDVDDSFSGNLTNSGNNHITLGPNSNWGAYLRVGGNGYQGTTLTASVAATNGNLHIDAAPVATYSTYLNFYAGTGGVAFGNGASNAVAWMGPDGDLWKGAADNSGSPYWHAGNDGSGSGLDADLLDGLNTGLSGSSVVLTTDNLGYLMLDNWIRVGTGTGIYNSAGAYIYEDTAYGWFTRSRITTSSSIRLQTSDGTSRGWYYADSSSQQGFLSTAGAWRFLVPSSGSFSRDNAYTIWDSGNDGSGSGLDADLLDGINSSGFVQTPGSSSQFISSDSGGAINPDNTAVNGLYYCSSVSLFGQTDGALFSQAYSSSWQGQIFQDYRTGQLALRGKNANTWQPWRTNWDSGNDGSGSGLDADLLDGIDSSAFLRSDVGDTASGRITFASNSDVLETSSGSLGSIEIYQDTAEADAFMAFHVAGDYAAYFGLKGDINDFAVGGWSMGATYYKLWHAGNDGSGSGLDADLLDGKDHTNFGATLATYGSTSGATGRIRCTAPFNTNSGNMFQIKILLYASYTIHEYVVGGYMYSSTNQWYLPTCIYKGNGTPDIIVGRNSSGKAYISIANGDYAGVKVCDMTRGYSTPVNDTYDPWTITIDAGTENSVTPSVSKVWHTGNDGSGSGLDADLLDGYQGSNYIGQNGNTYYQLTTWLQSTATHGLYFPNSGAGIHFYPDGLGDYGGFRIDGRKNSWGGLSLEGRVVFMHDGSSTAGIYDDVNNQWMFYGIFNAATYMNYAGAAKLETTSTGITVTGNVNSTSDIKLKKNIKTIDNALDKVLKLRGVYFDWKEEVMGTDKNIGLIAQEVEEVVPELVTEIEKEIKNNGDANAEVIGTETIKNVSYGNITAILIEAIKEQQKQIEELRSEIQSLKNK